MPRRARGLASSGRPLVGLALLVPLGCAPRATAHARPGETLFSSAAQLMPDASPGRSARLRLGATLTTKEASPSATEFVVALKQRREGTESVLSLLANGETLEREAYDARLRSFNAIEVGDQAFAPTLEILRYPVRAGDAWDWRGKVVYGGIARDAHADVTIAREGDDARSDVDLAIATDEGRPDLRRSLSFVFRKGKGVIRRSFGDVSSRLPVEEPWRP